MAEANKFRGELTDVPGKTPTLLLSPRIVEDASLGSVTTTLPKVGQHGQDNTFTGLNHRMFLVHGDKKGICYETQDYTLSSASFLAEISGSSP